jgi:cytochrome P450
MPETKDTADIVYPSPEVAPCPYGTLGDLRREAPIHLVPGSGDYLVSRREDILHVLRNPETFSNVTYVLEDGMTRAATLQDLAARTPTSVATFQSSDEPAHKWKRKLASAHFRPGQVRTYEPIIRGQVDELIDGFLADGEVEFISRFARPLGARATMLIMGLPPEDADYAEAWSLYEGQATRYHDDARRQLIAEQVRQMHEYIGAAIDERYREPKEDVLSTFVAAHVDANGPELGLQHARYDAFSVMLGGVSTSSHMLGNALLLLLQNPDQLALVQADHSLIPKALEEALRVESPVQWNVRLVREETEIGGETVPAGALLLLLFGSANRDESYFPEPDEFDVRRENSKNHFAFGNGLHFCLGAPLARLESQIAFEQLLTRLPSIRFAGDDAFERVDSLAFRGLERLDIGFDPAGTR